MSSTAELLNIATEALKTNIALLKTLSVGATAQQPPAAITPAPADAVPNGAMPNPIPVPPNAPITTPGTTITKLPSIVKPVTTQPAAVAPAPGTVLPAIVKPTAQVAPTLPPPPVPTSGPWTVANTDGITIDDCAEILSADALTLLRAEDGTSGNELVSPEHENMLAFLLKKERRSLPARMSGKTPTLACGTESDNKTPPLEASAGALKVGGFLDDFTIYFWRNGAVIRFYIDGSTFPSQEFFSLTERAFAIAALAWSRTLPEGTDFVRTYNPEDANYRVLYQERAPSPRTLASASPPAFYRLGDRNIKIYPYGLDPSTRGILPNVMAHEIGHVVGLRHSFAQQSEAQLESASFYDDPSSVMSYNFPPIINVNDVQNTRVLYRACQDGVSYYFQFRGEWTIFKHTRVDP